MGQSNILAVVIALGVIARVALWMTVPVTGDAVYHYSIARYVSSTWKIPTFEYITGGDPMWYPPAFHVAAALFKMLLGSEKITPLIFSVLSLFAFYILLKKFYPALTVPGMVLAAFLPVHVYYGAIGYVESLMFLLAPLILYSYLSFLESNDKRFLAASLILSVLSFLTHYQGFIPLAAISTHLLFRNRKIALIFLISGLLLASPWYVRNYMVFGNPIWPLLFDGKYPAHEGYQPAKMAEILTASKWSSLFFEYWIGAPNSGDDVERNMGIAGRYIPYSSLFLTVWAVLIIVLSLMALHGLYVLLRVDKNRGFFIAVILLSLMPLLLSNFVRMLVFAFPIIILGMSESLDTLRFKLKLTGVFINLSIRFSSLASRFNMLLSNLKRVALVLVLIGLVSPPFAYAFVYGKIIEKYTPFYSMVNDDLPGNAVVCNMMDDVFFNSVNLTVVSLGTIPEYRVGLKCLSESADRLECFRKQNVGYVCCTSLRTLNIGGLIEDVCGEMDLKTPVVEYGSDGVWGKCWMV